MVFVCSYMSYCYKIKLIECIGKLHVFSHDDDDNDYYQDDDKDDEVDSGALACEARQRSTMGKKIW